MPQKNWQGKIIQNKNDIYIPICKLGEGSYASVWSCYCKSRKEIMAIKIFHKSEHRSGVKEINIYDKIQDLKIRHIIDIFDHFVNDGHICIVIELMIGSLYDIITYGICDNIAFHDGFQIDFVIKTIHIVLESLDDLHTHRIIHGDIKPENILLYGKTKQQMKLLTALSQISSNKKIINIICETDIYQYSSDSSDQSDNDSSSVDNLSVHSEESPASEDPELIILSDEDRDSNDDDNYEEKNKKYVDINDSYLKSPQIKLADLGSTVDLSSTKKLKTVQTKYYRAPEIILGLEYNETCDIWALGCTMYELLTGNILFNPDEYGIDQKRCIISMVCSRIGNLPIETIKTSPLKQVFFTEKSFLKSYTIDDSLTNMWVELLDHLQCETIKKYMIVDLLFQMLNPDHKKRITSKIALQHPLFKLFLIN